MTRSREVPIDNLRELLERAGARIRSDKRADCPKCHTRYSVSYDAERGVFNCHGWSKTEQRYCDFRGNAWQLQERLGLNQKMSPRDRAEKLREMERERINREARRQSNRELSKLLRSRLRTFDRMEMKAHERGSELMARGRNPGKVQWDALEIVYRKRDQLIELLDQIDGRE